MKLTRKGFTLIEMLIVIVIIGILAAALIPRLTGIQGRARDTARKADLQQIGTALATYKLDTSGYPVQAGWGTGIESGILAPITGYMTSFPKESNNVFMPYAYVSNGNTFALASISEGGKANANWSGANQSAIPATLTGTTATEISGKLCQNGGSSTGQVCVGNAGNGEPRYVYVN